MRVPLPRQQPQQHLARSLMQALWRQQHQQQSQQAPRSKGQMPGSSRKPWDLPQQRLRIS